MKIVLQLITSVQMGGAENVAIAIAKSCADIQLKPIVVEVYRTEGRYADSLRQSLCGDSLDVCTLSVDKHRFNYIYAAFRLTSLIEQMKPVIVHSHTDIPDFVLAMTLYLLKIRRVSLPQVVRTIHNVELWPTHKAVALFVESAYSEEFVAAVSYSALTAYIRLRRFCAFNVSVYKKVIFNGVKPSCTTARLELDPNKIHVLFCGRLTSQKGADVLESLVSYLPLRGQSDHVFHVFGDGESYSRLLLLSKSNDSLRVYGGVPDAPSFFKNFDLVFMPSRFEGLPLVAIEASMAGVPTLISNISPCMEVMPPNWPLVIDISNLHDVAETLVELCSSRSALRSLGTIARVYAESKFSYSKMIQAYKLHYSSIVKERESVVV